MVLEIMSEFCDSCKSKKALYQENEYTKLCDVCWMEIAHNTYLNWKNDPDKYHVWVYNSDKLIHKS